MFFTCVQCAEEGELVPTATAERISEDDMSSAKIAAANCSTCTYIVPPKTNIIDGTKLGFTPGTVICFSSATKYTTPVRFINLKGTASAPIVITNCGGPVTIALGGGSYVMKTEKSEHFRITGGEGVSYGIKLSGANLGLTLDYLSTNFEVDHLEISNVGFAGIMAKTDPSCDNATVRGNFTMRNVSFHHNYVHEAGGEAFYVGNSFYSKGVNTSCGVRYPHNIEGVKIYNNSIKNSGREAIQLGSATKNAEINNNTIENFGNKNISDQRNGIQIGEGTAGTCYSNLIKNGKGNGILVLGYGDNVLYNNIIINAGSHGIFCDERYTPGPGFQFINNTIINPAKDGIRLYADLVPMNVVKNNVIVNPGSYGTYKNPRKPEDAYFYRLSSTVKVQVLNNYYTRNVTDAKFVNAGSYNYRLSGDSPLINKGASLASDNIPQDYYLKNRVNGVGPDIGASEY